MINRDVYYRNKLPHWQPRNATFFVTFRLHDSIPKNRLKQLQKKYEESLHLAKCNKASTEEIEILHKKYFLACDQLLDQIESGPMYLSIPEVANIIKQALHDLDDNWYRLLAYCIMSNHVHLLFDTSPQEDQLAKGLIDKPIPLNKIMHKIKGSTAYYANQILGRKGTFWAKESYDHMVRNEKSLERIAEYILENPVKAGLVATWEEWPNSYIK